MRPLMPGDYVRFYCPMPRMEGDYILGKLKRRTLRRGYVEAGLLTGWYPLRDMVKA